MSTMKRRKSFDNETSVLIGTRIREARGAASQEEFAQAIGVSRSTLTNYEAGRRLPNDLTLSKIAEVSGLPVERLLFRDPTIPFSDYAKTIEQEAIKAAMKSPGFIPRFMLSDDEYSFICLFRIMQSDSDGREILRKVVDYWEESIARAKSLHSAPPIEWGEGHLERLRAALRRGSMEEGLDPQMQLWVTFWEQVEADRERARAVPTKGSEQGPQ